MTRSQLLRNFAKYPLVNGQSFDNLSGTLRYLLSKIKPHVPKRKTVVAAPLELLTPVSVPVPFVPQVIYIFKILKDNVARYLNKSVSPGTPYLKAFKQVLLSVPKKSYVIWVQTKQENNVSTNC